MKSFLGVAFLAPLYVGRVAFAVRVSLGRAAGENLNVDDTNDQRGVSESSESEKKSSHLEAARRLLREERFEIQRENRDANAWRVVRSLVEMESEDSHDQAFLDTDGLHFLQFGREMREMHDGNSYHEQLLHPVMQEFNRRFRKLVDLVGLDREDEAQTHGDVNDHSTAFPPLAPQTKWYRLFLHQLHLHMLEAARFLDVWNNADLTSERDEREGFDRELLRTTWNGEEFRTQAIFDRVVETRIPLCFAVLFALESEIAALIEMEQVSRLRCVSKGCNLTSNDHTAANKSSTFLASLFSLPAAFDGAAGLGQSGSGSGPSLFREHWTSNGAIQSGNGGAGGEPLAGLGAAAEAALPSAQGGNIGIGADGHLEGIPIGESGDDTVLNEWHYGEYTLDELEAHQGGLTNCSLESFLLRWMGQGYGFAYGPAREGDSYFQGDGAFFGGEEFAGNSRLREIQESAERMFGEVMSDRSETDRQVGIIKLLVENGDASGSRFVENFSEVLAHFQSDLRLPPRRRWWRFAERGLTVKLFEMHLLCQHVTGPALQAALLNAESVSRQALINDLIPSALSAIAPGEICADTSNGSGGSGTTQTTGTSGANGNSQAKAIGTSGAKDNRTENILEQNRNKK